MPFVSPEKMHDVEVVTHLMFPGFAIATYVTFAVVVTAGHDTVKVRLPIADCTTAGTAGGPSGAPVTETAVVEPY